MENLEKIILIETEKKINIKLPYYCINICYAFKIIDAQTAIRVIFTTNETGIEKTTYFNSVFNPSNDFREITESEFLAKYNEIKSLI